jgi:PPP family 3-phenylpropionic acid transporter
VSISAPPILETRAARVTMVMSALYFAIGVIMMQLPPWLEIERGLSGFEIGALLSLAQFARMFTGPAIAYWADGARDRSLPIKVLAGAALAAYAAFLFLAQGFAALLILGFLALSLTQSMAPLIEAAALRATSEGKINYGVARGIGSVAFIASNIGAGALVSRFGLEAAATCIVFSLAITGAAAWLRLAPEPAPAQMHAKRLGGMRQLLGNRRFLILIFACGLIQSSHGFYYGFSIMVWRAQGMADIVGLLWAFGVAVEVAFLWSLTPIERRVSPEAFILIGAGAGVVRWTCMGFAPLGFWLWPLQAMHAMTFAAAHVGAMRILYREAPESSAAMAQTLYAVLTGGFLMGLATLVSGRLYDLAGAYGYWAMAALAAAGGALALLLLQPQRGRPATHG